MLQGSCSNCGIDTAEELRRWAESLAYQAAWDRTEDDDDDDRIARYIVACDRVQELLAEGDYSEAVIVAALLARKLNDNAALTLAALLAEE